MNTEQKPLPIRLYLNVITDADAQAQNLSVKPSDKGEEKLIAFTLSHTDITNYVNGDQKPCGKVVLAPQDTVTDKNGTQHTGIVYARGSKIEALERDGCSMQKDLPKRARLEQQREYLAGLIDARP